MKYKAINDNIIVKADKKEERASGIVLVGEEENSITGTVISVDPENEFGLVGGDVVVFGLSALNRPTIDNDGEKYHIMKIDDIFMKQQ